MPGKCVVIAPSFALESATAHMYDGVGSRPQSSQPSSVLVDVQCNYTSSAHPPRLRDVPANGIPPGDKDINHCSPLSVLQVTPRSEVSEFG